MKKSDPNTPPEQLTAYERWELPVLGEEFAKRARDPKATKPPTAAELEGIRESAYQEGLEQGKKDGYQKGYEEGRQSGLEAGKEEGLSIGTAQGETAALKAKSSEIQTHLTQLGDLMTALQLPIQEYQEEVEEAMLNLILAISRSVIFRDLSLGPEQIKPVVREALAALPNSEEQITVYVNPADFDFLTEHLPAEHGYRYSRDERVMAGGCRVETRHTLLDYTVEKRFQAAVQQMLSRHSDEVVTTDSHDFTDQMGEMSDFHRDLLQSNAVEAEQSHMQTEREYVPKGNAQAVEAQETEAGEIDDDFDITHAELSGLESEETAAEKPEPDKTPSSPINTSVEPSEVEPSEVEPPESDSDESG